MTTRYRSCVECKGSGKSPVGPFFTDEPWPACWRCGGSGLDPILDRTTGDAA